MRATTDQSIPQTTQTIHAPCMGQECFVNAKITRNIGIGGFFA